MYTKDESKQIKQAFWTAFGQYMALHPSADGLKINWVNYKTGFKHIHFKMDAGNKGAEIAIELSQPDAGIRALAFEQFATFRTLLHGILGEEWSWVEDVQDEYGKVTSRISRKLPGPSVFRQQDWPDLISFFKPRLIALDAFWTDAQYSFELFR